MSENHEFQSTWLKMHFEKSKIREISSLLHCEFASSSRISKIPMIFFYGNSALACNIYTVCGQPLALAIPSSELQIRNSGPAECAERLNNGGVGRNGGILFTAVRTFVGAASCPHSSSLLTTKWDSFGFSSGSSSSAASPSAASPEAARACPVSPLHGRHRGGGKPV